MSMHLTILRPGHITEYSIVWLEIITPQGSFVIQPEHAPLIVTLVAGQPLTFGLKNGKQESIVATNGIVEVTRKDVLVLLSDPT